MLRVNEIFTGISGEAGPWPQGTLCCFVRLQGCNLDCKYCDTPKSKSLDGGKEIILDTVVSKILKSGSPRVLITGGEPLLQIEKLNKLIPSLLAEGKEVVIETNGTQSVNQLNDRVDIRIIADYKMDNTSSLEKFGQLEAGDWIKFMIADRDDYLAAKNIRYEMLAQYDLNQFWKFGVPNFAMSAINPQLSPQTLTRWLIKDGEFDWTLNTQIHKLIGVR